MTLSFARPVMITSIAIFASQLFLNHASAQSITFTSPGAAPVASKLNAKVKVTGSISSYAANTNYYVKLEIRSSPFTVVATRWVAVRTDATGTTTFDTSVLDLSTPPQKNEFDCPYNNTGANQNYIVWGRVQTRPGMIDVGNAFTTDLVVSDNNP